MKASRPLRFVRFAVLVGVLGLFLQPASSSEGGRFFRLSYEVNLESIPPAAKELRIWVPLAASDGYQTIRRRQIQVPHPYQVTKDPEYGNDILYMAVRHPIPQRLNLSVQYEAQVRAGRLFYSASNGALTDQDRQLNLRSNRLMVVNDDIRSLARAITARAHTPLEQLWAIYQYVIERMTYEKQTPGWGQGDTLRACEVGTGNCTDFHSLLISLARASGIPARFRIGTPIPQEAQGEIPGYHCWAEAYLEGAGWIPVDASEAWRDRSRVEDFFGGYDPNRLSLATGRDILLTPQTANGLVNIFVYPYVELDGKTFDGIKTRFRFRDLSNNKGRKHA